MRVLVVDCYDSFTYNLFQLIGQLDAEPVVVMNDAPFDTLEGNDFERIILSPGPGRPEDSGLCLEVLEKLSPRIPTLGVCLGHQAICVAYGGRVTRTDHLMHGKTSQITHDGRGIFKGLKNPFIATRYHSLAAERESLPDLLEVTASSLDDGCVMGVRHTILPVFGVQFHPESILCPEGKQLIANFLNGGAVS